MKINPGGVFDSGQGYQAVSDLKRIHDLNVVLENPKGSVRHGKNWEVVMPMHYGYIRQHVGADGDQVDVYVGQNPSSNHVWVIDQRDLRKGGFDEHKVFVGYDTWTDALDEYRKAYHDGRADERIGGVTPMTMDEFKQWLASADFTKPAAGDLFHG